jgi:hypothetical protein
MRWPDPMQRKGGRPRKNVDVVEILCLKRSGLSWREIAQQTRLGKGTVVRYHREAIARLALSQNPKTGAAAKRPEGPNADRLVLREPACIDL